MCKRLMALMVLLLSCSFIYLEADSRVYGQTDQRQALVIFIEGMSFADFAQLRSYPHVNKWLKQAQLGALTIRTQGARTAANAYLQIGSGGQALYTERSGTAYQSYEQISPVETAMERAVALRGVQPPLENTPTILFPGIFRLHKENEDKPYTAHIGLLGSTLANHGISVIGYGNGDYEEVKQRQAALFAIDENGSIPAGDITEQTNVRAAGYPYGVRTNYEYIAKRLLADNKQGMIAVQLSDLARLYELADDMQPEHFTQQRDRVLADFDRFFETVLSKRTSNQLVMVLSPAVNQQAQKEKSLLTPIMLWEGSEKSGILTSATTRQTGIVNGIDLLPTILTWFSISPPPDAIGHVMKAEATGASIDSFLLKLGQIDHIYENRSSVMYAYVMLQIIILLTAALLWMFGKNKETYRYAGLYRGVRLALLSMLFFPVLFLLEPLIVWSVSPPVVLGMIIMIALAGALIVESRSLPFILLLVTGVTVGGILIDGFTGAEAMSRSYMGYDPVIGARFYGLGNEYEGVLIGSTILLASSLHIQLGKGLPLLTRQVRTIGLLSTASLFSFVLYYMAAPSLGTNAGGFLAGLLGFAVTMMRLQDWRVGKKGLLLITGGLVAGIVVLIVSSLLSSQPLTHVGRVAEAIVSGNWTEVANIVERKIEMNLRLIRVSAWSKVFAISLAVIGLLSFRPERYLRHLSADYPNLLKGFQGIIAGSAAGLVLNDSGIVTAATSIIFFVVPALYTALGESAVQEYST